MKSQISNIKTISYTIYYENPFKYMVQACIAMVFLTLYYVAIQCITMLNLHYIHVYIESKLFFHPKSVSCNDLNDHHDLCISCKMYILERSSSSFKIWFQNLDM
jgi:hypothetical protein